MIKKIVILCFIMLASSCSVFAAKLPDGVKSLVLQAIPNTDFRFDGVVILPDNTVYLPIYPSDLSKKHSIEVLQTVPENLKINQKPDIILFNNNFVLMKVITDKSGQKTVLRQENPFQQIKTGLLPQDMLVPKGLVIPANIKGIIGNLKIASEAEPDIKVQPTVNEFAAVVPLEHDSSPVGASVVQIKNKTLYVKTCYSKNIQVIKGENSKPEFALALKGIPVDFELVNNDKFMLTTTYKRTFLDIISIADNQIIKQIDLTTQPMEIVVDEKNNKAYISSPTAACIYVISLSDMVLKQKIKINGMCEKLVLIDNKLFYTDKNDNEIWAIELDNKYMLKDVGTFPNVSAILYKNGKVYMLSRTGNKMAVSDYETGSLITEFDTVKKPVSMLLYGDEIFVIGAENNELQVVNTLNNEIINTYSLAKKGFLNSIYRIKGTGLAIITDIKSCKYLVLNLNNKKIIKTNKIDIPISSILVGRTIKELSK